MGLALRMAREERGLSLRGLARLAGVHASTVLRIERGQAVPLQATRSRLSRVLEEDIEAEELVLQRTGIQRGSREHLRDVVSWQRDDVARYVVQQHPDGLTHRQVSEVLGLGLGTVHQVEAIALCKLREDALQASPRGAEVRAWVEALQERRAARERPASPSDWRAMGCPAPPHGLGPSQGPSDAG